MHAGARVCLLIFTEAILSLTLIEFATVIGPSVMTGIYTFFNKGPLFSTSKPETMCTSVQAWRKIAISLRFETCRSNPKICPINIVV